MIIDYNVTKEDRKKLVEAIAEIRGEAPKYGGAPYFDYTIGNIKVNRAGKVEIPEIKEAPELIRLLKEKGFQAIDPLEEILKEEKPTVEEAPTEEEEGQSAEDAGHHIISLPASLFTDTALSNLQKILDSKHSLICEALGTDDIPVEVNDEKISFPWFTDPIGPTEVKAWSHFVTALCKMANESKRITASEKDTDNPKYAFRCFLLRLGFIGKEYADERKVLLSKLSGNSAFKGGKRKEDAE